MSNKLRIVLAQLHLHVGDIKGNLEKHIRAAITAREQYSADIIVYPELSLTGYPPEDLLLRKAFVSEANDAFKKMISEVRNIRCLVGHPYAHENHLYNSCSLFYNGKIIGHYSK